MTSLLSTITIFLHGGFYFFHVSVFCAGLALVWVLWVPGNPRIFQQVYKEPTEFEEGKLFLLGEAKIRNPRIEIPNVDPAQ